MSILWMIVFFAMLPPALLAVAFAARSVPFMIWNYAWFLILAKVGVRAFDSTLASVPALVFALQYTFRVMRNHSRPQLDARFFTRFSNLASNLASSNFEPPNFDPRSFGRNAETTSHESGVIEAEFTREGEPSDSNRSPKQLKAPTDNN